MIAKRLREFLAVERRRRLRRDADAAQRQDGLREPGLRAEAGQWKMCYRAGKEATAAARAAAASLAEGARCA